MPLPLPAGNLLLLCMSSIGFFFFRLHAPAHVRRAATKISLHTPCIVYFPLFFFLNIDDEILFEHVREYKFIYDPTEKRARRYANDEECITIA